MFVNRVLRYCKKSFSFAYPSIVAGGSREMKFLFLILLSIFLNEFIIDIITFSLTMFYRQIFLSSWRFEFWDLWILKLSLSWLQIFIFAFLYLDNEVFEILLNIFESSDRESPTRTNFLTVHERSWYAVRDD